MDPRERFNDREESLRSMQDARESTMWTAMPGVLNSVDLVKMTAEVQIAVQGTLQSVADGTYSYVDMPLLLDCPIIFPCGGGYSLTFPLKQGDECLVVFASRCIDSWWQSGAFDGTKIKPQPPAEYRMHDLSDGFVLVGARSQPHVLKTVESSKVQLRTDDETGGAPNAYLEIDKSDNSLTIFTTGKTTVNAKADCDVNSTNGDVNITSHGKTTVTSGGDTDITATGNVNIAAANINLN